jgi:CDP-glycerol glycerophosphotransferase
MKNFFLKFLMHLFALFPVKKNKVLFVSYYGSKCDDNPRKISDALNELGRADIVWALNPGVKGPKYGRIVNTLSLKYVYELATSRVWVDNSRKRIWVCKRKGQYYIQTWHGNVGPKKIEAAAVEKLPKDYIIRAKKDSKNTDLMISGSEFFSGIIRRDFWYDGEILECGTPRLDDYLQVSEEKKNIVKNEMGLKSETHCILYAPTFRESGNTECYRLDFNRVLDELNKATELTWVFLVRMHPNITGKITDITQTENVIDVTFYPDLYKLIPSMDIVISDYSSIVFETGIIKKPTFIFATDLESYTRERGLLFDLRKLPFPFAGNNDELIYNILNFNEKNYIKEIEDFYESKIKIKENGNAAVTVAQRIDAIIYGK